MWNNSIFAVGKIIDNALKKRLKMKDFLKGGE